MHNNLLLSGHILHSFGDPKTFGLKDLCNDWKAKNWNPQQLVSLYKSVGARYFMALGNHHDNFDLWNSPYQEFLHFSRFFRRSTLASLAFCKNFATKSREVTPLGIKKIKIFCSALDFSYLCHHD